MLDMDRDEFRAVGHRLVEEIANFYPALPGNTPLTEQPESASTIVNHAWQLLEKHSLHNGHSLFAGYVTSSALWRT